MHIASIFVMYRNIKQIELLNIGDIAFIRLIIFVKHGGFCLLCEHALYFECIILPMLI